MTRKDVATHAVQAETFVQVKQEESQAEQVIYIFSKNPVLQGQPPAPFVILFIVPSQVRQFVLEPEQVKHLLSHLAQSYTVAEV
jgi:hypothetical protein